MFSSLFNDTSPSDDESADVFSFDAPSSGSSLEYVVNHVFFPVYHPQRDDYTTENNHTLARAAYFAACSYDDHVDRAHKPHWLRVTKMLENLQAIVETAQRWLPKKDVTSSLDSWDADSDSEQPDPDQWQTLDRDQAISQLGRMEAGDILVFPKDLWECRAIILRKQDHYTLYESLDLSHYPLTQDIAVEIPNAVFDDKDFQYKLTGFLTVRSMVQPSYIGVGRPVEARRTKLTRINDIPPVPMSRNSLWSRSKLWLIVQFTMQLYLHSSPLGRGAYKIFVLFFMCNLANHATNTSLRSILLHSMSVKILRRFRKLGPSPKWLCDLVFHACTNLSRTLDERWQRMQSTPHLLQTTWDPSRLDPVKDIYQVLPRVHDYISISLTNRGHNPPYSPFVANSRPRGTLNDFLDDFPVDAYDDNHVMLYDVEQAIREDVDDWVAHVTNIDHACEQLESLVVQYQSHAMGTYHGHADDKYGPGRISTIALTTIELWVALDKLVIRNIPILADYSPEIPLGFLERLLLCDTISIHRLGCAYHYLRARHARAHLGWSACSDRFTEHSFPCRYFDSSPHLRHLRTCVHDALLSKPLLAKAVIFELQCPASFDIWRSVTCLISGGSANLGSLPTERGIPVSEIPALQPYALIRHRRSFFLYSASQPCSSLYYDYEALTSTPHLIDLISSILPEGPYRDSGLQEYVDGTTHTSNEVLVAGENRDSSLSLTESITFGHLRSGGSLQWLNILRGLRSRTLDIRHTEAYLLLARTSAQVGPLGDHGELLWHQELQDTSFCHKLLDELESLFLDTGAGSSDGPAMAVISLLAFRLSSQQFLDVSERAIGLLQNVRQKTYGWVQEVLHDTKESHAKEQSLRDLRDIAAVCRSTLDATTASHELLSIQDIEIALSCAMLIRTIDVVTDVAAYSRVLLDQNQYLSLALEPRLRASIQTEPSDIGVDHAIQLVWPGHRPSSYRWEPIPSLNSRWLVCKTAPIQREETLHINLLDGSLLVDDKPIAYKLLPSEVAETSRHLQLFDLHGGLMVVPSDLLGMDFVTVSVVHNYYVHFGLRSAKHGLRTPSSEIGIEDEEDDRAGTIIRAQHKDTKDTFELIPPEIFKGELPNSLVQRHFHWLNLATSVIEIRPRDKCWEQSSDNWTIHPWSEQFRVTRRGQFLVNENSPSYAMISSRLLCLNEPRNLMITVDPRETTKSALLSLSIISSRYGLSFFINGDHNLESHDFRDMVYDEDQCIGTLFGLINHQLVLRPKVQIEADLIPKRVIVPDCFPTDKYTPPPEFRLFDSASYNTYEVDNELGCLKGIVDSWSRLRLAQLHTLTSGGCRPDPLTGRTGVEEAISLMWLAGSRDQTSSWCEEARSPQIRIALKNNNSDGQWQYTANGAAVKETYLFPSEVVAGPSYSSNPESLDRLFAKRPPPNLPPRNQLPYYHSKRCVASTPDPSRLRQLFSALQTNKSAPPLQHEYVSRLHHSAHDIQKTDFIDISCQSDNQKPGIESLRKHYVECKARYAEGLDAIKGVLGPKTEFEQFLDQCSQWPRVTPFVLLRCLASASPVRISQSWKKCLISLALLALDLQRARRLLRFSLDGLEEELCKELENEGCDGWDPAEYPDWLLIQLQGDFLIRRIQADVAKEVMSPRSGKNTVMQVSIGEGKTSVIIPICAAALADGNRLVRIVVPKALIPHTLHVLTERLCGLVNKPIRHLTFSRRVARSWYEGRDSIEDGDMVENLLALLRKHRNDCGIIVMQPEHVLSLKLACVEVMLSEHKTETDSTSIAGKRGLGHVLTGSVLGSLTKNTYVSTLVEWLTPSSRDPSATRESITAGSEIAETMTSDSERCERMLELQRFLEAHTRDILDESDEVLSPRFQLVYAIGQQRPFEGSPDRWVVIQQVLGLVKRHSYYLSTRDSHIIRCDGFSSGSFPHIHVLQPEGGEQLVSLIAHDILTNGSLSGLCFHADVALKGVIREFLLCKDIHSNTVKMVEEYTRQSASLASLLILRGLLAHNILLFALMHRRWRVDYGLHPDEYWQSTLLAIPYRAKDVPAETAEFGHPDVTILLTCLSYYYAGLNEEQLKISFEHLLQQDDPSSEYALWLGECDAGEIPDTLLTLSGVNIRSVHQWDKYLVPLFSRNKGGIDLYLSKVVFARYAKEFPQRISASYWDIAERKNHLTTGFSGTNDGQYLLPTFVHQDTPEHLHQTSTNARVLAYLLYPENSSYMSMIDQDGERWTTLKFLHMVVAQNPEVRVVLDIGAQILDLTNRRFAEAWLNCTSVTSTTGAIYFSEDNELTVIERTGNVQLLRASPLAQQLHRCVVYLDHAHTRGTDLKLPLGFRAAVTLGHKVTKDRLVQGCMRMRKLGRGHSVMFFAPHEVDQRIRGLAAKDDPNTQIATADILHWTIRETWNDIERQAPYWAQQGMNHQSRSEVWSRFCQNEATPKQMADVWVQPEIKSLVDMYMPCDSPNTTSSTKLPRSILERCEHLGVLSLPNVQMDEEQEREVSREIEREREVEWPPEASPATHFLHPDVVQFVRTGVVPSPSRSKAFRHVFASSIGNAFATSDAPQAWSPYILATTDFCETIKETKSVRGMMNNYLRPVQWVISGKMRGRDALVIVSPFEADQLMPEIRISDRVHLHLYIPRTTERMKPSDDLMLYSIPPLPADWKPPCDLIDQLNIFAGQLYLSDYASYIRIRRFLGIHADSENALQKGKTAVARNWFSNPDASDTEIRNRFEGTPIPLAMHLLAARQGTSFAETHMGRILDGWPLTEADFQSSSRTTDSTD